MTPCPLDPLSPIAPARVRALVVPIGRIKRERFDTFVDRLNGENVVYLRDISADGRPNRNMFSPLAFPAGAMFFELMTHVPSAAHFALSPFDLYREPLALMAIADGDELRAGAFDKRASMSLSLEEANVRALYKQLEDLRDDHPKVLVHRVLIFEHVPSPKNALPEGISAVPPLSQHKRTTMKTVMCDISALLLAEMTTLARSFESMSYIESPAQSMPSSWTSLASAEGTEKPPTRNSMVLTQGLSRSASSSGVPDRSQARMSVPSMPSKSGSVGSSSTTATPARPSTPVNMAKSALANPPTTFETLTTGTLTTGSQASPELNSPSRPGTADGFRGPMQGFGSGGLSERWRNKGKSRVQIVIGSMYMQAGRWTDAIRELVDGATVSKAINDHLWHGKALELVLVCLLLLSWADMEFQVPTIMLPQADRASVAHDLSVKETDQPRWARHLQSLLPELVERILALYTRVSTEHLPPHPFAEATVRLCKLLAAVHVCDGRLGRASLDILVVGAACPILPTSAPRFNIVPTRTQIAATLYKAFPTPEQGQWVTVDRIAVLGGIASVLGSLGFHRKKAMVVKGIVSVLMAGLVEARTRGAADVGIHPAAGLLGPNGANGNSHGSLALELGDDVEQGLDVFLGFVLKTYGVATFDHGSVKRGGSEDGLEDGPESATAAILRIQGQSASRFFGFRDIKLNVLRTCINFSEALPDFGGVMRFSSDLLRTAGSGVAPGSRREHVYPAITREEQVRLVANITKTYNLASRMGLFGLAAEYWDEFLLRGVRLEAASSSRTPIAHARSNLPDQGARGSGIQRTSEGVNPFIYNPFLKQPDKATVDKMLVAGELATFSLTLQNPYEIEVDIAKVQLDTEGVEFDSSVESATVGAYRTQVVKLSGTAKRAGCLRIKGAIIQVRGCRARSFPIFVDAWAPERAEKIKRIGLGSLEGKVEVHGHHHHHTHSTMSRPLKSICVDLDVIACQPVVVVKSTTLPQSSVMILEGERLTFSVTLENLSTTTPADFLLFSFQDSTQEPLQTALNRRDATAAELYEYELMLARKQALRCKKRDDQPRCIGPGQTATFDFEMLGKPGLTNGLIQIDYACLGVRQEEVGETFYTRQVSLDLTITVNASVEVARMDILPLHGMLPAGPVDRAEDDAKAEDDQLCLLALDLRNAWPSQMVVEMSVTGGARIEGHILPGHTSRVLVPLRRIYLANPHAAIPALNPSRQRQFVVSTKNSPDVERANREAFWYRETMLDGLRGTWRTAGVGRSHSGSLELRSMRLTSRMVEAVKVDDVDIDISVGNGGHHDGTAVISTDEFVQLRVRVTNRTAATLHATLRLMPSLRHRALNVALDLTRKLAWNGTLQQLLPPVPGGGTVETVLGLTALCRGQFEIGGSVEETRLAVGDDGDEQREKGGGGGGGGGASARRRADTQAMMDAELGARERRIWHSRRPCVVVVRDRVT